jgi:hypothetical protein
MPKLFYYIRTPLGEFASSGQAALAHKCDRSTILNRVETQPDQYQKVPKLPVQKKVQEYKPLALRTWPLTWTQYKYLPHETKEEIYSAWCQLKKLDPDAESTANEFFDAMDLVQEADDDQEQVI